MNLNITLKTRFEIITDMEVIENSPFFKSLKTDRQLNIWIVAPPIYSLQQPNFEVNKHTSRKNLLFRRLMCYFLSSKSFANEFYLVQA